MSQSASPDITAPHPWVAEGQQRIRFGVSGALVPDWPATRELAQTFEGLGFDSYLLPDHPLVTGTATWTHSRPWRRRPRRSGWAHSSVASTTGIRSW
jgi:alkanesulfonate monooxygenase SsuD/methylene tetrahydromethanopterin reductase-like flavin-dependent oxidoreductase (luciferase family)